MTMQMSPQVQQNVLDELIDGAIGLPLESQAMLLNMAKAMQYTRICIKKEKIGGSFSKLVKTDSFSKLD